MIHFLIGAAVVAALALLAYMFAPVGFVSRPSAVVSNCSSLEGS